jgi:WD40 repeat protein
LRSWKGHEGAIARLVVSPDGAMIASTGADKTVRVWRLADGAVTVLRGHKGGVASIEFRRDGKELVTAADDRTARVWDLASGAGRVLGAHDAMVLAAGFTDGDRRIVALDADGVLVDDPDDLPTDLRGLRAWIARATNAKTP